MSGIMMQLLGTAGGIAFADNFVAYYAKASTQVTPKGSYFDYGDDKIYIAGIMGGSTTEGFVLELSNQGEILQQKIDDSVTQHTSVYVDGSNDIYVTSKGSGTTFIDVIKYNSSFVRQWGVKYTKQTGNSITSSKIFNIFNQSDYVGIAGIARDTNNFGYDGMVGSIKKSDGTIGASNTTFKLYGSDQKNQQLVDAVINTDENAIITGITDRPSPAGTFTACMRWDNTAKRWNSLSSSKGLTGSSNTVYPMSMVNDSKVIYVLGYHQESGKVGTVDAYMVKYNSNNNTISNPVYQKGYGVSGDSLFFWSCSQDGTYVYATAQNGTTNYVVALKMSDGTIQWQNKITGGPYFDIGTHVDSNGSKLILVGRQGVNSHNQTVVMRVPKDGTGTGTYGSVTYASTSDISAYNLSFTVTAEENYDSEKNFTTINSSTSGTVANLGAKIESYN